MKFTKLLENIKNRKSFTVNCHLVFELSALRIYDQVHVQETL